MRKRGVVAACRFDSSSIMSEFDREDDICQHSVRQVAQSILVQVVHAAPSGNLLG